MQCVLASEKYCLKVLICDQVAAVGGRSFR